MRSGVAAEQAVWAAGLFVGAYALLRRAKGGWMLRRIASRRGVDSSPIPPLPNAQLGLTQPFGCLQGGTRRPLWHTGAGGDPAGGA